MFQICQQRERFFQLALYVREVGTEGIFLRSTVVPLRIRQRLDISQEQVDTAHFYTYESVSEQALNGPTVAEVF